MHIPTWSMLEFPKARFRQVSCSCGWSDCGGTVDMLEYAFNKHVRKAARRR